MNMIFRETSFEVGDIHKNDATYPVIHSGNKYIKNMSITLTFILNSKIREITSDNQGIQERHSPEIRSPIIPWVPLKGLSYADMRKKLYDLGVTRPEVQNIAMTKVQDYVQRLVNRHLSLSGKPGWSIEGLQVNLFLTINRITVLQRDDQLIPISLRVIDEGGRGQEEGLQPADESIVRKLKRKRVDETMVGKDEKCSVCLEMLVDNEELIVLPCEHVFHDGCVSKWFKTSHFCPLCRFELPVTQTL